jgi:hypothetical protein
LRLTLALAVAAAPAGALVARAQALPAAPSATPAPAAAQTNAATVWSAPAPLSACAAEGGAWTVFPSDGPAQATGPGAIVWDAQRGCAGGAGVRVAELGAEDLPRASVVARTATGAPLRAQGPLLAGGAPHGQIAIAALAPAPAAAPASVDSLIQGPAGGPFATLAPDEHGSPVALATAYLGDLALATPAPTASRQSRPGAGGSRAAARGSSGDNAVARAGAALRVLVERFYAHAFSREDLAGDAREGPVEALALALDYRSEALVAWSQRGSIFAQLLPAKAPPGPIQRLARSAPGAHLSALLSDDYRGIVAWSTQSAGHTAVYLDRSATGVSFAAPQLLESYADPGGAPAPAASPSLVRLSSEGVVMAWAGASAGDWVVRAAPVDLNGMGTAATLAAPGADALLASLAPGPDGEVFVLWSEPAQGPLGDQALFAARGLGVYPERVAFGEGEPVAPPGPVADARLAVDPASGRAVASWQGQSGSIEYSIRRAEPGQ